MADLIDYTNAVKAQLAGKAPTGHNHDDRYYTETEADGRFVRTVNGTGPDGSGNVVVDAGSTVDDLDDVPDSATRLAMTTAERAKLSGVAEGAEPNVNADWAAATGDAQILNKPALGTSAAANIGTGAGQVKPGDWKPAAADVTDSTATGRSVLTAADAATARSTIGAMSQSDVTTGIGTGGFARALLDSIVNSLIVAAIAIGGPAWNALKSAWGELHALLTGRAVLSHFGPVGTADDSATWAAALAAVPAGGTLLVPNVTTNVSPGMQLTKPITIEGQGWGSCIRVKDNAGAYRTVFGAVAFVDHITFRNLRFDQNVDDPTADIRSETNYQHYVINVNADDLLVEDCYFWPIVGNNTVITYHNRYRTRIVNNTFLFKRGAAPNDPFYDNSAIYTRSRQSIVTGNIFLAEAVEGVYAYGAIEIHSANSIVTGNYTENYATLCNYAPTSGVAGDQACIISDNIAVNCNKGIQLWIVDSSSGLVVANNLIQVRQLLWRLYAFGGIVTAAGAGELSDFVISNNQVDFQVETASRTIVDPTNGLAEQQSFISGISLASSGSSYSDGLITGNQVSNCPFVGYRLGQDDSTLTRITVQGNVSTDNGHYAAASSNTSRSHFLWRGTQNYCVSRFNLIRETFTPLLSRFQHNNAGPGVATGCVEEGNRFVTTATTQALSARVFAPGWSAQKAPVRVTDTRDPSSMAPGATTAWYSAIVPGAAIGDRSDATWSVALPSEANGGRVRMETEITSADSVRYRFVNGTTATHDLAAGTVSITVS